MSGFAAFPEWLRALAGVSAGAVATAWLATLLLRRQSAAWRHLVWLFALCAPLAALPLSLIHGRVTIPILPRAPANRAAPGGATGRPAALQLPESPVADAVTGISSRHHPTAIPGFQSRFRQPVKLATGVWWCGAVFFGLRLLFAHRRLQRLIRDGTSPAPPDLLRHLEETKQDFQVGAEVRLWVGPLTEIPFCQGTFQPTIHFPESWRQWDEERIKICLRHELAHIVRRDLLTLLAGQFACILCWFNPLVWYAAARLHREAERSADDLVLGGNIAPAIYAASLVAITEHCQVSPLSALSVALAMARPHRLRTRIDAILDPTLRRRSPGRATVLAVSCLALGALAATMIIRLSAAPAEAAPEDNARRHGGMPENVPPERRGSIPADRLGLKYEAKFVEVSASAVRQLKTEAAQHPGLAELIDCLAASLAEQPAHTAAKPDGFSVSQIISDPEFQELIRRLNQCKGVDLLSAPSVESRPNQKATVSVTREFIYPTKFSRVNDPAGKPMLTPTKLETKNLGCTLTVEGDLSPARDAVDLNVSWQFVELEGFVRTSDGKPVASTDYKYAEERPVISTQTFDTCMTMTPGSTLVLGSARLRPIPRLEAAASDHRIEEEALLLTLIRVSVVEWSSPPPDEPAKTNGAPAPHAPAVGTAGFPAAEAKPYPYGVPVKGKPGFVTSPYAPDAGYVDVHGFARDTQVRDPYTGKQFLVP